MSGDLEKITHQAETAKDLQIAKLEDDLQGEKDSRNNERFVWMMLGLILLDMIAFPHIGWIGNFLLIVMEFALLLVLARIFGIDEIYAIIQNCMDSMSRIWPGKPEKIE